MKSVWKWQLEVKDEQVIEVPVGTRLLTVSMQHGVPAVWGLVPLGEPQARMVSLRVRIAGTGHPMPEEVCPGDYVGTFSPEMGLVFHVFQASD